MKLKLDANNRKYIKVEVELEGEAHELKYYEKNTKQIKQIKKLTKDEKATMADLDDLTEKQFFENLHGDEKVIKTICEFYEENGNIYDFINSCDEELGKQKNKG